MSGQPTPTPSLPVQLETCIELALNLRTAKALGLKVPAAILVRADSHSFVSVPH